MISFKDFINRAKSAIGPAFKAATTNNWSYNPPQQAPQAPAYDENKAYQQRLVETAPDNPGYSGGGGGGGGGGGSSYDPVQDQKNTLIDQIKSKFNALQNVFNGLFGGIDTSAKEKTADLQRQYGQQVEDLNKGYGRTVESTDRAYGGRGLSSSSYLTNAQTDNQDIYNRSLNDTLDQRNEGLANIGRYVATAKAGLNAQKSAYNEAMKNLDQYDVNGLNSLLGQINTGYSNANQQRAGLLTDSQYIKQLQGISPIKQQGTSQLASKLQNLVTSSAPQFAKREIAKGLIRAADITDKNAQSYWQNEFERMLGAA